MMYKNKKAPRDEELLLKINVCAHDRDGAHDGHDDDVRHAVRCHETNGHGHAGIEMK